MKRSHSPDPRVIERMFADVAGRYDFLNQLLSLGRHHRWRAEAAGLADPQWGDTALDVCTGTGDMAEELGRRVGQRGLVVGFDFCQEMVEAAQRKMGPSEGDRRGATRVYGVADAERLPMGSGTADCATIAFGIRNVRDPERVLAEMTRVLKVGGRLVCLEFGLPQDGLRRGLVRGYERSVVPLVGRAMGRGRAYSYLAGSIEAFGGAARVREMMARVGLGALETKEMNLGSVYALRGVKR